MSMKLREFCQLVTNGCLCCTGRCKNVYNYMIASWTLCIWPWSSKQKIHDDYSAGLALKPETMVRLKDNKWGGWTKRRWTRSAWVLKLCIYWRKIAHMGFPLRHHSETRYAVFRRLKSHFHNTITCNHNNKKKKHGSTFESVSIEQHFNLKWWSLGRPLESHKCMTWGMIELTVDKCPSPYTMYIINFIHMHV